MKSEYDIIVVGAGPAGSTAARYAAEGGASVLVLERDREIGIPVRCAEAAGLDHIAKFIPLNPQWIAQEFRHIQFVAPSGAVVRMQSPERAAILHRRLFDHALAEQAVAKGAQVCTKANVQQVDFSTFPEIQVKAMVAGEEREFRCRLVIAADGVESRIARFAGIRSQTALKDIESCAQMMLGNIDVDPETIEFHFADEWAPGGYAWVFPKGEGVANVGLGVNCARLGTASAWECLQQFVSLKFPEAVPLSTVAGGVPVAKSLSTLAKDGIMIVGDAARQVNPVSGGGIGSGMTAAKIAGEVAAMAYQKDDYSHAILQEYQKRWERPYGRDYARMYRIKEWIMRFTDADLNGLAERLQGIDPEQMSLLKLFKAAIRNKLSLLVDVIKLFANL